MREQILLVTRVEYPRSLNSHCPNSIFISLTISRLFEDLCAAKVR
jgi:hypothetical protein